ncbi:hypothetical protein SVAN01_04705 [Stagonosporopsis vannaccii]|nr:hypothetical protein SVAN01_04705 [Stagonosporopsis vannaccii]
MKQFLTSGLMLMIMFLGPRISRVKEGPFHSQRTVTRRSDVSDCKVVADGCGLMPSVSTITKLLKNLSNQIEGQDRE